MLGQLVDERVGAGRIAARPTARRSPSAPARRRGRSARPAPPGPRAARRSPPAAGRAARSRDPRAPAAPAAPAGSRSAPRTAPGARSPSQTGPAPRRAPRSGVAPRHQRQNARSSSSCAAGTIVSSRGRPAHADRHRAPAARPPSAPSRPAPPRSRRARTAAARSGRGGSARGPRPPAAGRSAAASMASNASTLGSSPSPQTASGGRFGQRVAADQRQAVAERQLDGVGVQRHPQQRRDHRGGAVSLVDRPLELGIRGLERAPAQTRTRCAR